jgi:hypothetical protein
MINNLYLLFLFEHGLSILLSSFSYKFMFKYLEMNFKFLF